MILVMITVDSMENAEKIAETLLEEKLAACVNMIPNVKSIYVWQGEKKIDTEILMFAKTEKDKFPSLVKRVKEMHPYELPEIVGIPVSYGLPEYIEWVKKSLV